MRHFYTDRRKQFGESPVSVIKSASADVELCITEEGIAPVEGFGGCFNELGYRALSALPEGARAEVMDELFGSCNFNFCRLPVGANDFAFAWYSYDETDGDYDLKDFSVEHDESSLLPYVREALKRRKDLKLFASPWSPPAWMKTNGQYNSGRLRAEERVLRAYARYFSRYLREYEERGVHVDILCPQNEVIADTIYPSCLYTGKEFEDLLSVVAEELAENNPGTQVWLGTINSDNFEDYVFRIFENKTLRAKIGGAGFQWLGKEAIQKTHAAFPSLPLMQTESECGDGKNTFEFAEYIFSLMQHYFSNGACAYIYWNMILGNDPRSTWGWAQNSLISINEMDGTWKKNPEFYLMKHFSAFVDRGDVGVKCTGSWCANSVVFRKKNGKYVVVVHNPLDERRPLAMRYCGVDAEIILRPHSFNTILL